MQTIVDLIASSVIFGWLFLISITAKTANDEDFQANQGELLCQENLVEVTKLLEYDFRKIGYCKEPDKLPNPTLAILLADSSRIKFLTDLDLNGSGPDGNLDSLYYYLGPPGTMQNNPNTCILYRVVNNLPAAGSNLGVTSFKLTYYDQFNNTIPTPVPQSKLQTIFSIQICLSVQNVVASALQATAPINQQFQTAFFMQRRLAVVNYLNR
jgi:type II secretory pathway component PulJ